MGSWFGLSGYLPQKYAQKDMERDMEPDNGGLEDDYRFKRNIFRFRHKICMSDFGFRMLNVRKAVSVANPLETFVKGITLEPLGVTP